MTDQITVRPVTGMGEITAGTDLAAAITEAADWLRDGDILVVTSKIVSKAEGRLVAVPRSGPQRDSVREAVLAEQTARLVARRGQTRIVATHHGFVMAAAGIDTSNVDSSWLVLLPVDPDASARALRTRLRDRHGLDVAVIISDTMGRPWRHGLTDVGLGAAGIDPVRDHCGEIDPYGNELHITQMAIVDELAGAAELVKGKCDGVPVAVVRGLRVSTASGDEPGGDGPGVAALLRSPDEDLFRLGTAEAHASGLRDAATLTDARAFIPAIAGRAGDPDATDLDATVARAIAGVAAFGDAQLTLLSDDAAASAGGEVPRHTTHLIACAPVNSGRELAAEFCAFGVGLHRLRCALAAHGLATVWLPTVDSAPNGLLAVGPHEIQFSPEYLPI